MWLLWLPLISIRNKISKWCGKNLSTFHTEENKITRKLKSKLQEIRSQDGALKTLKSNCNIPVSCSPTKIKSSSKEKKIKLKLSFKSTI